METKGLDSELLIPFIGHSKKFTFDESKPGKITSLQKLKSLAKQALTIHNEVYESRLEQEFQMIHQLELDDYFLALFEIHQFALSRGHLMIVKGSYIRSFLIYLLGFSLVNPIHYRLQYDWFNSYFKDYGPDIHFDISLGSTEVIEFARQKFGWDNSEGNDHPWLAYSKVQQPLLNGNKRHCKISIVEDPDLSGLEKSINLIRESGKNLPTEFLPIDDKKTFAIFSHETKHSISYFNNHVVLDLLQKLKPQNFYELAAICAIGQPMGFEHGITDQYIQSKLNQNDLKQENPILGKILDETNGVLLYRDQVFEILHDLGGLAWETAEELLRKLCQWKFDVYEQNRTRFIENAERKNLTPTKANEIYDLIAKQGPFTMYKATILQFTMVAYQTVYLENFNR